MSNEIFNKRIYGCAIIKSLNANYNADFTKQPRTLPNGIVYATDKALKYTVRHFLYKNYADEKILYFTRNKVTPDTGQYVPMSLSELYECLFDKMEKGDNKKKNPKWMFFHYENGKVSEALQVVKPTKIKAVYLDTDAPDFLDKIMEAAKNATEQKVVNNSIDFSNGEILKIEEDDPFYFYIDKDKSYHKIEIEEELLAQCLNEINISEFGNYNKIKILYNLLNCIDVRLFGATFTGDTNVSIHGPVQINHGVDRFAYNGAIQNLSYTEQIKSPVRNDKAKGGDAEMTTIGSSSKTMEAHYVHNFSINPKNLADHIEVANELSKSSEKEKYPKQNGLSIADVNKLQEGLRCGATLYDSTSKAGVENELLIWVELKEDSKQVLPNFTELISIKREESGKIKVDLEKVCELLSQPHIESQIERVDIFLNKVYTEIENEKDCSEKLKSKIHVSPIELVEVNKMNENE